MFSGTHFYNQTMKKAVAVFGTLFNNIKIVKTGSTETRVPIAYGPRKKFLARIQADTVAATDKSIAIKLPRMSFEITGIAFDAATKLNRLNKRVLSIAGETAKSNVVYQSVPYTISLDLNILAKNQDDALQIFEQILPTFTPEYTVTIKDMEGPETLTDVPIILTAVAIQDDYEGDFQTRRTLIYTLSFDMKVKFTGATTEGKIIRTVDTFFYTNIGNVTAKVNSTSISDTNIIPIDSLSGGIPTIGQAVIGAGIDNDSPSTGIFVTDVSPHGKQVTLDRNVTLSNNTVLTFNFVSASGEENVRVAVGSTDEPPLDETDTITTTFGFNHG